MLTFWWVNKVIKTGFSRDLTKDDLCEVDDNEKSNPLANKLERSWNPKASKFDDFYRSKIGYNYVLNQVIFRYISKCREINSNRIDLVINGDENKEERVLMIPVIIQ